MDIEVSMMLGEPLQHALQGALESEKCLRLERTLNLKVPNPLSIARDNFFRIPLNLALNIPR